MQQNNQFVPQNDFYNFSEEHMVSKVSYSYYVIGLYISRIDLEILKYLNYLMIW